jgi:hypothetical protein
MLKLINLNILLILFASLHPRHYVASVIAGLMNIIISVLISRMTFPIASLKTFFRIII